jgi:hypothetical protein
VVGLLPLVAARPLEALSPVLGVLEPTMRGRAAAGTVLIPPGLSITLWRGAAATRHRNGNYKHGPFRGSMKWSDGHGYLLVPDSAYAHPGRRHHPSAICHQVMVAAFAKRIFPRRPRVVNLTAL